MSHFNQVANTWDNEEKINLAKEYAKTIKSYLPQRPKKVLEVGCGTGVLGSNFIESDNELFGIDTSSGMLEVFNKKFEQYKNVKSILINLETEALKESHFDLVISSMAFHHLKNPHEMLKKLLEVTKDEAYFAIIDLDKEDGTFHPDPKNMGVFHFGFSEMDHANWISGLPMKLIDRKIIHRISKNEKEYPLVLALFKKI